MEDLVIDRQRLRGEILRAFSQGYNCAESIVGPFASALGRGDADILRLATPFGAGIGGRRDVCGILTGGTMIIGLVFGRSEPGDSEQKSLAYKLAAQYYRWFKEQQKVRCSEIVSGKFSGHTEDCVNLMAKAQAKLVEIIEGGLNGSA